MAEYREIVDDVKVSLIQAYQDTTFATPSNLERSLTVSDDSDGLRVEVNFYAEFLDQGTRYIRAQPFITSTLNSAETEELIANTFEEQINERIEEAVTQSGGRTS